MKKIEYTGFDDDTGEEVAQTGLGQELLDQGADYTPDYGSTEHMSIEEIIQKNLSKSIRELRTFFSSNNFITEKGDQNTNVINVAERRTYLIPETSTEEFFITLDTCRRESLMMHYSERQETALQSKSGIMIDFDRYQRSKDPQINDGHFTAITRSLSKLLRDVIDFSEYATNGRFTFHIFYIRKPAVVLEPPKKPGETPTYKDGFHILIPELQVVKGLKRYINQELLSRGVMKNVFNDIDHIDSPEKMLDTMSASNPVHFFGNSKPGKPAYPLVAVHRAIILVNEGEIDRETMDVDLVNTGSFKLTREGEPVHVNLTYELSLSFYMQKIGGHHTWLKKIQIDYKPELETKIQLMVEKAVGDIIPAGDILAVENNVDLLALNNADANYMKKLLGILDISYATEYEKWFKVICAIAHTSNAYKQLAVWFSHRKPESWSMVEIDRVWAEATNGRFVGRPVTLKAIKRWALESAPQQFAQIDKEHYVQILARFVYDNEGRVEHAHAAKVSHVMIGDKFVVDVGRNDKTGKMGYCWYEFVTPGQAMRKGEVFKYRKEIEPDNVHLFIGEHMPKVYAQVAGTIKDRKDNAANEGIMKYWAGVERNFKLYTSKLSNDGFQTGIVKQAQYRFRQRGFYEELDSYEDIIGVGNGLLKLGPDPQLIKGFHEYKISKYTETNYVPFNKLNPQTATLLRGYRDIYPEKDVFKFMMYHASTGLDNKESSCILTMCVGGGRNGKSTVAKMVHNTLGNMYAASGKASLLTAPMERGDAANSAQMQQKDKRYFYIDEFNKCEILNTTRVKMIVSPGWQSGRDLFERQSNFKNTSNTICLSNFDFIIDTTDHGTWRRMYYYRNKVKFCENPNPANPYEKPVDHKFYDEYPNDPAYLEAQLSIMAHYNAKLHLKYGGNLNMVPVPTIQRETELFRNRQDSLNRFIGEMIVISPDADIGLPTLALKYIDWYGRTIIGGPVKSCSSNEFHSQIENSRVATNLEKRPSGIYYLVGLRLKSYPEEPLQDNEQPINAFTVITANPTVIGRADGLVAGLPADGLVAGLPADDLVAGLPADDPSDLRFLQELTRNVPVHNQRRVCVIDPSFDLSPASINIDDLVAELGI